MDIHNTLPYLDSPKPIRKTSITDQLQNGVRALMLDTYDFQSPTIDSLKEIEFFMSANPSEIVTIILEDYVHADHGLTKVFTDAGLMKYWFPLSNMPTNGGDWPLVSDMVKNNHMLLVFILVKSKETNEDIAYQWNYMVENQCESANLIKRQCIFSSTYGLLGYSTLKSGSRVEVGVVYKCEKKKSVQVDNIFPNSIKACRLVYR
ncbi:PI-PLC X domain-containing protein At5g67130 [Linum grandiflorum]